MYSARRAKAHKRAAFLKDHDLTVSDGTRIEHHTAEFLLQIAVPTLVLAGRHDHFTPASVQRRMADLIPDSELIWFDESGHLLPIEVPDEVAAAIVDFLARWPPCPGAPSARHWWIAA